MDLLYVKWTFLSTGGSIGDALFFFISGFTLLLKPIDGIRQFPNWYKKRITRIYPSVFAVAIISCLFFNSHADIIHIITHGGRWFVSCIMIFYIFIYFIGAYAKNIIIAFEILVAILTGLCFCTDFGKDIFLAESHSIYASHNSIRWLVYFIFMLFGAHIGMIKDKLSHHWSDILLLIGNIIVFYLCFILGIRLQTLSFLQYISIAPMLGILFYAYKVFSKDKVKTILSKRYIGGIITFIGGLCLEIYLVQFYLFTDKMNAIFPLNIIIMFLIILAVAYATRCLARIILQTFQEQSYDWKKIIEI